MKPIVTIVGRPNVGKSTLFNQITRTRDALVDDLPGVTRVRHYGNASWNDADFTLIDTGGFAGGDQFSEEIRFQILQAIEEADLILFVLDGKAGLSPFDRDILDTLRAIRKPVIYVVNKIDSPEKEVQLAEFYRLGLETLYPVSAEHRDGMTDFLDALVKALPPAVEETGGEESGDDAQGDGKGAHAELEDRVVSGRKVQGHRGLAFKDSGQCRWPSAVLATIRSMRNPVS